jgi:hydroxymethylglutaryl-CoA synthase
VRQNEIALTAKDNGLKKIISRVEHYKKEAKLVGILSYGAYIPIWRISRDEIARASGAPSRGGERSVASWDEDSLVMGVEAGCDCLRGIDSREIDGLYFATVSPPFKEKQSASIIASALDLRKDVYTFDITGSPRAATLAVKAASDMVKAGGAKRVLVIAADSRRARPNSDFEQTFGDGAAALLIGEGENIADIVGFSTVVNAIPGPWKREEDIYLNVFDARFDSRYGLLTDVTQAVSELMEKCNIAVKDISKFALYAPDLGSHMNMARSLQIDRKTQLQDLMFANVGITGTPHCLLLLVAALETAKANEAIVCASHGEGSDAFLVRTTEKVQQEKGRHRGTKYISSKRLLPSYGHFAKFKKEIDIGYPEWQKGSVIKYWRDESWALRLYGMRCKGCGTLQYPISRICMICGEKDNYEEIRLARKGKVFSFNHDYLLGPGNMPSDGINPTTRVVADLNDGCRLWLEMTDHDPNEVNLDTPIELSLRLLHQRSDYRFYGWKARPVRE